MSISVLILTLNEEVNLPRCLEAVSWSDDIVVFDSGSADRTIQIAEAAGARVVCRPFDNERDHRAASLRVGFKHPWVFNPDADEVAPPALCREMMEKVAQAGQPCVAYRVRVRNVFMGRWLKHASLYPTWVVRLFRPEALAFERSVNLRYVANGREGKLHNDLLHYSFNKGLHHWFEKHNRYSSIEAAEMLSSLEDSRLPLRDLLSRDPVARRRALKEISFRLPFRPELRFLYMYFARLGFLDGRPGLTYCRLMSIYEYMIGLKAQEMRTSRTCSRQTT